MSQEESAVLLKNLRTEAKKLDYHRKSLNLRWYDWIFNRTKYKTYQTLSHHINQLQSDMRKTDLLRHSALTIISALKKLPSSQTPLEKAKIKTIKKDITPQKLDALFCKNTKAQAWLYTWLRLFRQPVHQPKEVQKLIQAEKKLTQSFKCA